jgi:ABC-type polar amino acid transport system ATPase subunit
VSGVSVQVDGLCKRFGTRDVLCNVSLRAAPGEIVALIGPSGSGKSTLLRCINALTPMDAGAIRVGEHVLAPGSGAREAAAVRRLFGIVFQDFQLFPHLTVLDNVTCAPIHVLGRARAEASERARALLARVDMLAFEHAYPKQLSGGQKQRVAIARALAMEPRGLLHDEITSALDPELKSEVLAVVDGLRRDGLTQFVVTHEMGFARRAADRVVVIADGCVIEDGPASEVIDRPREPRTRSFLARVWA